MIAYSCIMHNKIKLLLQAFAALIAVLGASLSHAAPTQYQLVSSASQVGFVFTLNGAAQNGTMPVAQAYLMIDPQNLAASKVDVHLDVQKTRTGMFFATDALKSPSVLDAAQFPTVRFVSTNIRLGANGRLSDGAIIEGNVTMRGITRPITFQASLFRIKGSTADDLSQLTIRLTGSINRSEFGASGFADIVGDSIQLDIVAHIQAER